MRKDGENGGSRIRQIGENCGVRKVSKMLRSISRKALNSYDIFRLRPGGLNWDLPREEKRRMEQQSKRPNTLNTKTHI